MNKTPIQWTTFTVNPIRARWKDGREQRVPGHYCEKISPGCKLCYASKLQPFHFNMPEFQDAKLEDLDVYLDEKALQDMLRRRKPCKVFVCDMTDIFGHWVPDVWLDRIFAVAALNPNITLQVLTKRAERMREYLSGPLRLNEVELVAERMKPSRGLPFSPKWSFRWPLPNVWLGVSVENQEYARRAFHLAKTPAAVRFVSYEPALAAVDYTRIDPGGSGDVFNALTGELIAHESGCVAEELPALDQIIYGGESGPNARPNDLAWARKTRDDCWAAGVKFFMKQAGAFPWTNGPDNGWPRAPRPEYSELDGKMGWRIKLKDSHGGDPAEWPEDLRVRELPAVHESRITNHA